MPTYTKVTIATGQAGRGGGHYPPSWMVRLQDGDIWAVYVDSASGISAKVSSDVGASWGVEEKIFTPTTPVNAVNWSVGITRDANNLPVVFAETKDADGLKLRVFRRESGVWVAKGTITPVADGSSTVLPSFKYKLYQHPSVPNTWIYLATDFGGVAGVLRIFYSKSTDDLASFGTKTTIKDVDADTVYSRGAADFAMSLSSDLIEGVFGWKSAPGIQSVSQVQISAWNGAPTVVITDDIFGPFGAGAPALSYSVAKYPSGDIQLSYEEYHSGAANFQLKTRKRTAGVWGAADASGYITSGQVPDSQIWIDPSNNFWIYTDANGTGVQTVENTKVHYKSGGWLVFEFRDDPDVHGSVAIFTQANLTGSQPESGHFVGYLDPIDSTVNVIVSSDVTFPAPPTPAPTTPAPTTPGPTTFPPTTTAPTTPGPTTPAPSTPTPTTADHTAFPFICCGRRFVAARREVVIRAWLEDFDHQLLDFPLSKANSRATLFSEEGQVGDVASEFDDPIGSHVLLFRMPVGLLLPGHAYFLRLQVVGEDDTDYGTAEFALGTT